MEPVRRGLRPTPGRGAPYRAAKRGLDVLASAALLLLLAPLFVAVALALRLEGGPVLFRHRRIGRGGRQFDCLKFRTMRPDAEAVLVSLLEEDPRVRAEWALSAKLVDDPRVTRRGRFLRRWGLDELPQLVNVVRGEMSLVGPRPVPEEELERYGPAAGEYLGVRPGLTGLWQVNGDRVTDYRERVELDVRYIRTAGLLADLVILLRTPSALFRRRLGKRGPR
jgi:exopolysaccharide production protein ExoY